MTETEDAITQCAGGECRHKSTCTRAIEPIHTVVARIEPRESANACGKYVPVKIIPLKLEGIR